MSATIKPISQTAETITFRQADWQAHLEDIEDRLAVARSLAEHSAGTAVAYSEMEIRLMLDGTSSLAIWRERRGLPQRALAAKAGISPSYLAEIEAGRKPGSLAALSALSHTMGVPIERLKDAPGDGRPPRRLAYKMPQPED